MPERLSPAALLLLPLLGPLLGCGEPAVIPNELQLDSAAASDGADGTGGADGTDGAGVDDWPCSASSPGSTHSLHVQNNTAGAVSVIWVDTTCVEVPYAELAPGGAHDQTTGLGHVWLFRDVATQAPLAWIEMVEAYEEVTLP
jgi:hypothetical protein